MKNWREKRLSNYPIVTVGECVKTLKQLSYCYRRGRLNLPEDIHVNRFTPKVVTAGSGGFNPPLQ